MAENKDTILNIIEKVLKEKTNIKYEPLISLINKVKSQKK